MTVADGSSQKPCLYSNFIRQYFELLTRHFKTGNTFNRLFSKSRFYCCFDVILRHLANMHFFIWYISFTKQFKSKPSAVCSARVGIASEYIYLAVQCLWYWRGFFLVYAWVPNSGVHECTDFFFFVCTPNDWIVTYKLSRLTHFFHS